MDLGPWTLVPADAWRRYNGGDCGPLTLDLSANIIDTILAPAKKMSEMDTQIINCGFSIAMFDEWWVDVGSRY